MAVTNPKLLYLVTEDWYFCSHRLELAAAAQENGYRVSVATRVAKHGQQILDHGLALLPLNFSRSLRRPWQDLALIVRLARLYRTECPDVVHHVALKPVLLGWIALLLSGVAPAVINAPTGLGHVFTARSFSAGLLRPLVALLLGMALRRKGVVIVQNPDDRALLIQELRVPTDAIELIPGSGTDLQVFSPSAEAPGVPVVTFVARLLADKGIYEFVEAARRLKLAGLAARFVLVGDVDEENPSSITKHALDTWCREEVVEWWGWRDDMVAVYQETHIVCLPSHREGLPKALVEAAASGRAIVTTDVPGCREVVSDGENGLLVGCRNVDALAEAIRTLVEDADLRQRMGAQGPVHAQRFDLHHVIAETMSAYAKARLT